MAEKKIPLKTLYEVGMCVLALVAVVIGIINLMEEPSWELRVLDFTIYGIFLADYLIGIWRAPDKKAYVRSHVWDLVALIPFDSSFRAARILRLIRAVSLLLRLWARARVFLDTCGFKYVLMLCLGLLSLGAVGFHFYEQKSLGESFWWAIVTSSTVGYGDCIPVTVPGRIIGAILMVLGLSFLGMLSGTITTFFSRPAKRTQEANTLRQELLDKMRQQLERVDELSDEDIDTMAATLRSLRQPKT